MGVLIRRAYSAHHQFLRIRLGRRRRRTGGAQVAQGAHGSRFMIGGAAVWPNPRSALQSGTRNEATWAVRAVAAALAAESASGIVFGMNVPDSHLPLLKSMTMQYTRRMQGAIRVEANLTDAQRESISRDEKGDLMVAVILTDESGQQPIECQMNWAWTPKKRK